MKQNITIEDLNSLTFSQKQTLNSIGYLKNTKLPLFVPMQKMTCMKI